MSPKTPRPRLDEILSRQGKISETQLKVALKFQKIYGGKLASHILHHGFLTESELVDALAEHFGCPGVILANKNIPRDTLDLIPHNIAAARRIIAFAHNPEQDRLDVACENPTDDELITEIVHVTGVANIRLFVAVETSLNLAIKRQYDYKIKEEGPVSQSESGGNIVIETPDQGSINGKAESRESANILLVVRDAGTGNLLKQIFDRDGHRVSVANSVDDMIDLTAISEFNNVLVHEQFLRDQLNVIRRIRDKYPLTRIRVFSSASELILDNWATRSESALQQNLELFTSLLTMKERLPNNYNAQFGRYVDRLCDQFSITAQQKALIMNTAYLYDRAKFYYMSAQPRDFRTLIVLTTKLLESAYYEPAVIEILRFMYIDLRKMGDKPISFELLSSNILTIVDIFCDAVLPNRRITLDQFEKLKLEIEALIGIRLIEKVIKAFYAFMQEEMFSPPDFTRVSQIMIYSDKPGQTLALDLRLWSQKYRTIVADSLESFYHLYNRSKPDMLVMNLSSDPREIISFINDLVADGVDIKDIPTVLMVKNGAIPALTSLCEHGIDDIIDRESSPDFVMLKINKIQIQWGIRTSGFQDEEMTRLGSRGSLSDMNIIDLLQVFGPGQRTTKIIATPSGSTKDKLEIILDRGNIVFAQLSDLQGAEAIYAAMTWKDGSWAIEPVERENLVRPNNELSNESILIEGCRLIDEMNQKL